MMKNVETVSSSLLPFIDKFVTRQEIVLEAMRDTWPHLLIVTGQEGDRTTLHDAVKRRDFITQSGLWGNKDEWRYFIYGTGCRLVHIQTSEPIEWNSVWMSSFGRLDVPTMPQVS